MCSVHTMEGNGLGGKQQPAITFPPYHNDRNNDKYKK